jgi:hypothetical protein
VHTGNEVTIALTVPDRVIEVSLLRAFNVVVVRRIIHFYSACLLADDTNFFAAITIAPLSIGLHNSSLLKIALPAIHFTVGRVIEVPLGAILPRPIANLVSEGSKPGLVTALILHHFFNSVIVFLIMDARD